MWGQWELAGVQDLPASYVGLDNELTDAIQLFQPRVVVYESALVSSNRPTDPAIPRLLLGLAAHVESACYRESTKCLGVHAATARKQVLGSGTFRNSLRAAPRKNGTGSAKAEVRAYITEIGWNAIGSEHACDAAIMLIYQLMQEKKWRKV